MVDELSRFSAQVDKRLAGLDIARFPPKIGRALSYVLRNKSIRVRPFLFKTAYLLNRPSASPVIPFATGIELLQLSTLIVDDFLDRSDYRWKKRSAYAVYGPERTVLLGEMLGSLSRAYFSQCRQLPRWVRAVALIDHAYLYLSVGQYCDLELEGRIPSLREYLELITNTTARFISAVISAGGILAGLSPKEIGYLGSYGLSVGIAYQIRDDIFDVIADPKFVGKPKYIDILNKRFRLPIIYATSDRNSRSAERIKNLVISKTLSLNSMPLLIRLVEDSGAITKCIVLTQEYSAAAIKALSSFPRSKPKDQLIRFANLVSKF